MPRAGFYEIRSSKIRFGRDGRWYADDEPITNDNITRLFSRHLVRQGDGSYRIEIGIDRAPVEVEDTAYVVQSVGEDGGGLRIALNDGTTEVLDLHTLSLGPGNVVYCRVKDGTEKARFLRPAYYQLAPYLDEQNGRFVIRRHGQAFPLGSD